MNAMTSARCTQCAEVWRCSCHQLPACIPDDSHSFLNDPCIKKHMDKNMHCKLFKWRHFLEEDFIICEAERSNSNTWKEYASAHYHFKWQVSAEMCIKNITENTLTWRIAESKHVTLFYQCAHLYQDPSLSAKYGVVSWLLLDPSGQTLLLLSHYLFTSKAFSYKEALCSTLQTYSIL